MTIGQKIIITVGTVLSAAYTLLVVFLFLVAINEPCQTTQCTPMAEAVTVAMGFWFGVLIFIWIIIGILYKIWGKK